MSALRIRGDIAQLHKRTERERKVVTLFDGSKVRPGLDPHFKGNAKAALSVKYTDSMLGSSTRQGWRLSPGGGATCEAKGTTVSLTTNDAHYCAVSEPMAYVARKDNKRVKETDRL